MTLNKCVWLTDKSDCENCNIQRCKNTAVYNIAKKANIDTSRFIKFINLRFPHELDAGYITTWANRIKDKSAIGYADTKTYQALKQAGY